MAQKHYEQAQFLDTSLSDIIAKRLEDIQKEIKKIQEGKLIQKLNSEFAEIFQKTSLVENSFLLIEKMQKKLGILDFVTDGKKKFHDISQEKESLAKRGKKKEEEYQSLLSDTEKEKVHELEWTNLDLLSLKQELDVVWKKTEDLYQLCLEQEKTAIEEKELEEVYSKKNDLKWYLYLQRNPERIDKFSKILETLRKQKLDKDTLETLKKRIAPCEKHNRFLYRLFHFYFSQWLSESIVSKDSAIFLDLVETRSGRKLLGQILKEDSEEIEIEVEQKSIRGSIKISKGEVVSRKKILGENPKQNRAQLQFIILLDALYKKNYTEAIKHCKFLESQEKEFSLGFVDDIYQQRLLIWENCPELLFQIPPSFILSSQKMLFPLKFCANCQGTKRLSCSDCNGKGHIDCTDCEGTGKIYKERQRTAVKVCYQCDGTGRRRRETGTFDMSRNGKGMEVEVITVTCSVCKGRGVYDEKYKVRRALECPHCSGKGIISSCDRCSCSKYISCEDCRQTGFALSDSYTKNFVENIFFKNKKQ